MASLDKINILPGKGISSFKASDGSEHPPMQLTAIFQAMLSDPEFQQQVEKLIQARNDDDEGEFSFDLSEDKPGIFVVFGEEFIEVKRADGTSFAAHNQKIRDIAKRNLGLLSEPSSPSPALTGRAEQRGSLLSARRGSMSSTPPLPELRPPLVHAQTVATSHIAGETRPHSNSAPEIGATRFTETSVPRKVGFIKDLLVGIAERLRSFRSAEGTLSVLLLANKKGLEKTVRQNRASISVQSLDQLAPSYPRVIRISKRNGNFVVKLTEDGEEIKVSPKEAYEILAGSSLKEAHQALLRIYLLISRDTKMSEWDYMSDYNEFLKKLLSPTKMNSGLLDSTLNKLLQNIEENQTKILQEIEKITQIAQQLHRYEHPGKEFEDKQNGARTALKLLTPSHIDLHDLNTLLFQVVSRLELHLKQEALGIKTNEDTGQEEVHPKKALINHNSKSYELFTNIYKAIKQLIIDYNEAIRKGEDTKKS